MNCKNPMKWSIFFQQFVSRYNTFVDRLSYYLTLKLCWSPVLGFADHHSLDLISVDLCVNYVTKFVLQACYLAAQTTAATKSSDQ